MGLVEKPADPQGCGRLSVVLDLSRAEVELTVARLKEVLSKLQYADSQQRSPSPGRPAEGPALASATHKQPAAQQTGTYSPASGHPVLGVAPVAPSHISALPQRIAPKPAVLAPIQTSPLLPQPVAASSPQWLPHAQPAASQPLRQPRSDVDVSFSSWAQPEPISAAELGPQWKECWRTDQGDHNSEAITSLVYMPSLSGLPGGDGHAGWLISASRQLLNLWECSASGGRGEPSLQFMHQQTTETISWNLAPEVGTGLLLAAAQDPGRPTCCVAMHSLHAESGLFAPRGRMPLPPIGSDAPALPGRHDNSFSQVVSLHPLGGPLMTYCAASFGGIIAVYSTTIAPGEIPKSKTAWPAHSADVTSMHCSQHGMHLFSGARDGSIHIWELKAKPSKPSVSFRHSAAVTGLHLVNDRHLATCSMDGRLLLWDIRRPMQPLRNMASPDGSGIVRMAVSPFGDSAAFGTVKGGLFSAPVVLDEPPEVTSLPRLPGAACALAWNSSTGELYAACNAVITVLQPVL